MTYSKLMNARCIDLHIPMSGGVFIASFCFERTALEYVREHGIKVYKIVCQSHTIRREGM